MKKSNELPSMLIGDLTLADIIAQLPGHIYWKDLDFRLVGCNTRNWQDIGYSSLGGALGKCDDELFPKMQAERINRVDQKVIEKGETIITEEESLTSKGIDALYLSHKSPLKDRSGKIIGLAGVSLDVTDEKRDVTTQLKMLENIIALMPGHVYWVDRDNRYLGCNNRQAKASGLSSRTEIVGLRNSDLPWNKGKSELCKQLDKANEQVMSTGKSITVEEPGILNNKEVIFLSNKVPLYDSKTNIIGMVGISVDITAEIQAEQLEREKLIAEKQSEVMKLMSSAIAHELRTPQASIDMTCEQLKDVWPILLAGYKAALDMGCDIPTLPDDVFEDLSEENIGEHLMRINNNCRTIVNMMNKNVLHGKLNGKLVRFSPKQVIENTIKDYPYRSSLEERAVKGVSGADFSAKGDPDLFEHVILNLLKNAIYHVLLNREGHIEVRLVEDDSCNTIYFEDTGPGISQEDIDKIFESFFTKNTDNGTGVGLSLCKNVIENNMRGKIWCESELGKYTRFCLQLPKVNDTN